MKKLFFTLFLVICLIGIAKARNSDQSNQQPNDDEKYYKPSEVDEKIKIISEPYAKTDGCSENSGQLSLRVYFHKSGKISKVEYVKPSSCSQYNENAVSAAKQIKFKPAIKNGQEVSCTTIIEYTWQKY